MPALERPQTPEFLREAAFTLFGEACLKCFAPRPLEIAHIRDWPSCVTFTRNEIADHNGPPPANWVYEVSVSRFHHIANVIPLCANCHTLYDQPRYDDVDLCSILELRNAAIKRPDVLRHAINFVGIELSGRPNRCQHKDADGKRQHSHQIDSLAALMPLPWIKAGYRSGVLTDNPHMVVTNQDGAHHHVHLDHGYQDLCLGEIAECGAGAWIWQRRPAGNALAI